MDNIDATSRNVPSSNAPPPSLLIVILDTSPPSWAHLNETLPLASVLKTLIIFLNAHIALNHANRVAVLASHVDTVQWLYPTATSSGSETNGTSGADSFASANKFRPFSVVEHEIRSNLASLLHSAPSASKISSAPLLSTALSTALTYANIQYLQSAPTSNVSGPSLEAGVGDLDAYTNAARTTAAGPQLVTRILVFSVSPADPSGQYISLMNAVFAAQRLNIPIDMIRIGAKSTNMAFLQQASDVTRGIYMNYDPSKSSGPATNGTAKDHPVNQDVQVIGLLQTLMMAYLPDTTARAHLISAGSAEVDFRAACFCHGKVVDSGGVCSVCLSIFCLPISTDLTHCPTCNSRLKIPKSFTVKPAVIQRKKKKRKKTVGEHTPGSGTPSIGTPLRNEIEPNS